MDTKNLIFYLISGNEFQESNRAIYEECYRAWKEVWQSTFLELNGVERLFSDGFTRQDKVCAIFEHEKCISLVCLRYFDFNLVTARDDSIFSSWDQESFKTLVSRGPQVICCNQLGVRQAYRGETIEGVTLKSLNIFLSVQVLMQSGCDVMAGTTRADRGVNRASFAHGAQLIKTTEMHGVAVDLVCFYKEQLANDKRIKNHFLQKIWDSRIDLTINKQKLKIA